MTSQKFYYYWEKHIFETWRKHAKIFSSFYYIVTKSSRPIKILPKVPAAKIYYK